MNEELVVETVELPPPQALVFFLTILFADDRWPSVGMYWSSSGQCWQVTRAPGLPRATEVELAVRFHDYWDVIWYAVYISNGRCWAAEQTIILHRDGRILLTNVQPPKNFRWKPATPHDLEP